MQRKRSHKIRKKNKKVKNKLIQKHRKQSHKPKQNKRNNQKHNEMINLLTFRLQNNIQLINLFLFSHINQNL